MFENWCFGFDEDKCQLNQVIGEDEQKAFELLEQIKEPMRRTELAPLACKALESGSVELLRRLLERSQPGQVSGRCYLRADANRSEGISGIGSLLMLAAMLDRPQQAQLLLDRGYDCNGTGLDLAEHMLQSGNCWGISVPLFSRCNGCVGSTLSLSQFDPMQLSISCPTPLAAALLCGSRKTAQVLLRQEGVWKGESSSVCRAAVMVLENRCQKLGNKTRPKQIRPMVEPFTRDLLPEGLLALQLEALRLIFCPELDSLPDRKTFLRSFYLQPASFVDFCHIDTLRYQLEGGFCSEEDARHMLEVLSRSLQHFRGNVDRSRAGKLLLIKQYFPQLCRESWAAGIFLREIIFRIRNDLPYQTLMSAWKQLTGTERDLTWGGNDFWSLPWRSQKPLLEEAEKDGKLVMDMDAMPVWSVSSLAVTALLKKVTFRRRDGAGVSGLLRHLLLNGNLRTLQTAAKQGFLAAEDPKSLIEFLIEHGCVRQDVRSMVLTYAGTEKETRSLPADWRDLKRWECWCSQGNPDERTVQALLSDLLYGDLSPDQCLRTIQQLTLRPHFVPALLPLDHPVYPTLSVTSLTAAICCAEQSLPMALLLKHQESKLQETMQAQWGNEVTFSGSPLALAAALGRTEQVRLLLDHGIHPDEKGGGGSSRFYMLGFGLCEDSLFVTPVLAAILFGQEDTARLLLSRGASCDFSDPFQRKVLTWGSAKTLALAEALPGVNFEAIPKEELNTLRAITGENGERTVFWNGLCA